MALLALLAPAGALPAGAQTRDAGGADAAVRAAIRERVAALASGRAVTVEGERLLAAEALAAAYGARDGAPLWLRSGRPRRSARALAGELGRAGRHGLAPGAYHEEAAVALLGRALDAGPGSGTRAVGAPLPESLADLDLLLSDAFLILGSHLVSGRVDPERLTPEWIAVRREVDLVAALGRAAAGEPERELAALLPEYPEYPRLVRALARYRALVAAGGWQPVPDGETFDAESPAEPVRLAALRQRLRVTGDLPPGDLTIDDAPRAEPAGDDAPWDEALTEAVRTFQRRHGLDPDGRVGARTLAALNVPAEVRVDQIVANLERWRWLPQELGRHHLRVNIAGFQLEERRDGETVLEMPVVVGRPYRRTPVFSDRMRYLVLNPYWDVPTKLAVEDKLPLIQKDAGYLAAMGFTVYAGWSGGQQAVDPATVDWSSLGRGNFPYRLRQDPGPKNALGRVKFMFPNRFNVYLHDTPERSLFQRAERDLSSGCIRLARPLELAENLLSSVPGWDRARIEQVLASGRETVVNLTEAVPVHLLYLTAWAEAGGTVHFRRDLYERDAPLVAALAAPPPRPRTPATAAPDRSP